VCHSVRFWRPVAIFVSFRPVATEKLATPGRRKMKRVSGCHAEAADEDDFVNGHASCSLVAETEEDGMKDEITCGEDKMKCEARSAMVSTVPFLIWRKKEGT